jgi:hypothetical protein
MSSAAIATLVRMIESLPAPAQERAVDKTDWIPTVEPITLIFWHVMTISSLTF